MSYHYNEAFENPDYHFSETLEIDRRRSSQKNLFPHQSPYDSSLHVSSGEHSGRGQNYPLAVRMASMRHGSEYSRDLPRVNVLSRSPYGKSTDNLSFEPEPELALSLPSTSHLLDRPDTRGISAVSEEEKLVGDLASMSTSERIKAIQKMPENMKKKREIRNKVLKEITEKSRRGRAQLSCCTQWLQGPALSFRRFGNSLAEYFHLLRLWHGTLKIIGAEFGTSVLSYFIFLKWLLTFNLFSFLINFGFITIPQFFAAEPNNVSFTGLELFTGAGYFQQTVLYYGFYTNATISKIKNGPSYNMQLAYIFTVGIYFAICFLILLLSMAKSFCRNFINPQTYSGNAIRLLCTWDFNITNEKAVKLKQKNLSTQIKEDLMEVNREVLNLSVRERLVRIVIHLVSWAASLGTAVAACAGVYFLSINNAKLFVNWHKNDLESQAATLLLPIVTSLLNTFIPLFYSWLGHLERFQTPGYQIYVTITRIIGTAVCASWGPPEFDIGRNVLELIYVQTLTWIGILFSPLLPGIQMISFSIVFYVKKVSLMMNCQPPRKAWRTAQMMTSFMFLLFFPSFVGVLSVIGVTVWRLKPSEECGPFRGLSSMYAAVSNWIKILEGYTASKWVVWIYSNLITSALFFFILSVLVLIITYLYWQIIEGRKTMAKLLRKQIINEGKDKIFLLEKLRVLQRVKQTPPVLREQGRQSPYSAGGSRGTGFPQAWSSGTGPGSSTSAAEALALALRAREAAQWEDEDYD
ncbi:transmembrane channel-like protein 5 isoform B [Patagioenas fasciata monilis]|uniref:Transmembrane channel-like protein n=1 Tax=Patagioenas fasciata monilis TaxID=372326 RepID=A0A1V4JEQ9_PATFA|nr:transmembrane channel-like protein 5 isoform B [Patagioenas fasciata monilis]